VSGPHVWVAIHEPLARLRMSEAAAMTDHQAVVIDPAAREVPTASCAAVISDLVPFSPSLDLLEHVRRQRQGMPIMLYLPVKTDADVALTRAIALGIEEIIFARGKPDERDRLVVMLRRVLAQGVFGHLLDRIAAAVPRQSTPGFKVLKHYGIKLRTEIRPADHLDTVSAALGHPPRTLQRLLHNDGWPGPKELLDWMMLLMAGVTGELPIDRAARRRLQRAARRMAGIAPLDHPPDVERVVGAFVERLEGLAR
jgi:hypothetical protein